MARSKRCASNRDALYLMENTRNRGCIEPSPFLFLLLCFSFFFFLWFAALGWVFPAKGQPRLLLPLFLFFFSSPFLPCTVRSSKEPVLAIAVGAAHPCRPLPLLSLSIFCNPLPFGQNTNHCSLELERFTSREGKKSKGKREGSRARRDVLSHAIAPIRVRLL